ncbi:hypothetical protein [Streptomyces sp. 8ZJF_21]|uniref:hypothetical protein n=1 Tax=Streptomyces sp. 8ZJF_21 TaxID=2903141 RepID=UPI001E60D3E0|nr:hypothetical protein [Streptomyces sp. 8ZJF_21]MCD9593279.1 hypothetical protein [Streptomyces sp. 8ZJF_21]
MQEALIGLGGVVLGLAGSTWTTLWTNRQSRRNADADRITARQEEATREIRLALISIHHMKAKLTDPNATASPDRRQKSKKAQEELEQLIHTIDTYIFVIASAELRARLSAAMEIMWYWHLLEGRGHPVWHAVSDASECIGAYLRSEKLPEEPQEMVNLRDQAALYANPDE